MHGLGRERSLASNDQWRIEVAASPSPWTHPHWVQWIKRVAASYARWTGKALSDAGPEELPRVLFHAPFVLVSHGKEADPVLCYGNQTALKLWEMSLSQFLETPSRYTAEPMHRDERAQLLERTTRYGFVDDYQGIRISASGARFRIHQATVWNVVDAEGTYQGQAAMFHEWTQIGS